MEQNDESKPQNDFTIMVINTKAGFLKRLWWAVSNPFLYIFAGKIRL